MSVYSRTVLAVVLCTFICFVSRVWAQTGTATLTGRVTDESGAVLPGSEITLLSVERGTAQTTIANQSGIYLFASIQPGQYHLTLSKPGFKKTEYLGLVINVQDHIEKNFQLQIGSVSESITVTGGAPLINTEDASVSTVVDRNFAENLPMNGRSFQTLIQLTPGVVLTVSDAEDNGQFSVDGQRAVSNNWMVDGVSANIGATTSVYNTGNGLAGGNAGFSVLGGTNSLVSVDALQEFRIQTSTYAPEFGRTPGAQISIVTRSGTNQFHGTAFDYLRNDVFDASNWFANANGLPKPEERQNDFGGTFSGRILRDHTFFFFSYEGLRLRLPQVTESLVPDMTARQDAVPAMQPFFDAFPLPSPNTPDDPVNQIAQFNASYSNSATLDAYSLRIDHRLGNKLLLFGRYNYSPSELSQRGANAAALSGVTRSKILIQTATLGVTWTFSPATVSDFRFNYSRTHGTSESYHDTFGGAVPPTSLPLPDGYNIGNTNFALLWAPLAYQGVVTGPQGDNVQRQINIVEAVSTQKGSHNLKFGVDFRRLTPIFNNFAYAQNVYFSNVPTSTAGIDPNLTAFVASGRSGTFLFRNFSAFAQDTWRLTSALTLTYGLRWDLDFAPSGDPAFLSLTGFDLANLSDVSLAPAGTPPFRTTYGNVAPRVGVAYRLRNRQNRETVLRGGFGIFYDLATSEAGNSIYAYSYPYGATKSSFGSGSFPLDTSTAAPPPITVENIQMFGADGAFDPQLKLPYTLQWNVALEQTLGAEQSLSVSYVGSVGRRLLQTAGFNSVNANFASLAVITNAATSDYNSLQVQFQRRLSKGLQGLASYVFSHSIDTASGGSLQGGLSTNGLLPGLIAENRGPSDFDIRHAFSGGITYEVPGARLNKLVDALSHDWSIENVVQARSALPVTIYDGNFLALKNNYAVIRPDLVPGSPLYLYGPQYPGGKGFNPSAFTPPPTDSSGNPLRQGNLGRNALRGFGATQWDFAVHRDFPVRENWKLQFRAEMFNILNHPNFAPPVADISNSAQFGRSNQMLANFLAGGGLGSGAFSPLYQIGGPRSIQLALKLFF